MRTLILLLASAGYGLSAGTTIVAVHSGKCADVQGQSKVAGALVQQWACWGGANQAWNLIKTSDGSYELQSVSSGLVMTVNGDLVSNGDTISQQPYSGVLNQRWNMKPITGGYQFVVEKSGKCLDVRGGTGATANGVLLQQWTCIGPSQTNQIFRIQSAHKVTLNWDASSSSGVSGYNVYRATASGGPYSKLTGTPVAGLTYTDSAVLPGQGYYYVATAVASGAESVYSNESAATIPSP